MRCPECNSLNEVSASSCASCGLLLLNVGALKRRREDLGQEKRRASDARGKCPSCRGDIAPDAVCCPHCQHILTEEHRLKITRRMRANINYASWVAYIFGLVTFLLFRPVGLISIASGLFLSILYYALPEAERQPRSEKKGIASVWPFLKAQFRLERISVPLPALRKRRVVFVGTPVVAAGIGFLANFFFLQQPMNQVLKNAAFEGIEVSTHYRYWVVPGEVVFNLESIGGKKNAVDVHTVLLEYAKKLKDEQFRTIELQFRGEKRFVIAGSAFQKLGREYDRRNFAYVLFEFPKLFRGKSSPQETETVSDSEALGEFHDQWYARELERPSD